MDAASIPIITNNYSAVFYSTAKPVAFLAPFASMTMMACAGGLFFVDARSILVGPSET